VQKKLQRAAELLFLGLEEESQPPGWLGKERLRLYQGLRELEEQLGRAKAILTRLRIKGEEAEKIPVLEETIQKLQREIKRRKAQIREIEEIRKIRKEIAEAFESIVNMVGKENVASDADVISATPYFSMPFVLAHEFIKNTGLPLTTDVNQLATAIKEAKIGAAMAHATDVCISALFRMRTSHRVFSLIALADETELARLATTKPPKVVAEEIKENKHLQFNIDEAKPQEIVDQLARELYLIALRTVNEDYGHLITHHARKWLPDIVYKILLYSTLFPRVTRKNTEAALKLWRTLMYGTEELPLTTKELKELEYKAFMGINTINSYLNNTIILTLPKPPRPRVKTEEAKEPQKRKEGVDLSEYTLVIPESAIIEGKEKPVEEPIVVMLREPIPEKVAEAEEVTRVEEVERIREEIGKEIEGAEEEVKEKKAPSPIEMVTYDKVVERARKRKEVVDFIKELKRLYNLGDVEGVSIFTFRESTPVPITKRVRPMSFGEALEAFDETLATVVARHLVGKAPSSSNVHRWASTRYEGALKIIPSTDVERRKTSKELGFVIGGLIAFRNAVESPMVLSKERRWASEALSIEGLKTEAEEAMEKGEVEEVSLGDLIVYTIYTPDVMGRAEDTVLKSMVSSVDRTAERVLEATDKLLTAPFSDIAKAALILGLHEPYEAKIEGIRETLKLPSLIGAVWRNRNISEAYAEVTGAISINEEYAEKPIGSAFAKVNEILQSWNALMKSGGEQAHFWGKIALLHRDISSLENVLTELRKAAENAPHELPEGITFEEFTSVVDRALRRLHNQRMAIEASLSAFPVINKVGMIFSELSEKLRKDARLKELANICREVAELEDEGAILEKEKEINEFAVAIISAFKEGLQFFKGNKEFAIFYLSHIASRDLPHLSLGEVYEILRNVWSRKKIVRGEELEKIEDEAKMRATRSAKLKLGAEVFAAVADYLQKHTASYETILKMCVGAVSRRFEEYDVTLSATETEVDYSKGRLYVLGVDVSKSMVVFRQLLETDYKETGRNPAEATYQQLGTIIENMLHTSVVQLTQRAASEITKKEVNPRNVIIEYIDGLKKRVEDFSYEAYRRNRPLYFYTRTLDGILDIIKEHIKTSKVSDDVLRGLFSVYSLYVQLKSLPMPQEQRERILEDLAKRVDELNYLATTDETLQTLVTNFNNLLAIQETLSLIGRRIKEALQKDEVVNLLKSLEVRETEEKKPVEGKVEEEITKPTKRYTYAATLSFNTRGLPEIRVDLSRLYDVSGQEPIKVLTTDAFRAIGESKALYVSRDALLDYAKSLKTVADFALEAAQVEGDAEAINRARYFGEYVDALVRTLEKIPMDNIILRIERPGEIKEPSKLYEVAQEAIREVIGREEYEKEIREKEKALQSRVKELEGIIENLESRVAKTKDKELIERLEQARAEYNRVRAALDRITRLREVLADLASKELPELSQLPFLFRRLHERLPETPPEEEPTAGVVNLGALPFLPITTDALQSMINHTALAQWHDLLTSGAQGIVTGVMATYLIPRALHEFLRLFPSYDNYVRNIHNLIEHPPAPRSKIEEVMARLMHGERIDENELRFTLDHLLSDIEKGKVKFEIPTGLYKLSNPLTRTQLALQEIGKQIAQNIGADPEVVTTFLYQALIGNGVAARRKARTELAPRLFGYFAAAEHALMGG
jgi:hypothetical protein